MAVLTDVFDKNQEFTGTVEKVFSHKGSGWFSAKIRFDDASCRKRLFRNFIIGTKLVNCKGDVNFPLSKGMHISFECDGAEVDSTYGTSFHIVTDSVHIICDNETSAVAYLTAVDGGTGAIISAKGAAAMYRRYGDRILDACRKEPDTELVKYAKRPEELRMYVIENDLLEGIKSIHRLLTPQVCEKAIARWGKEAYETIKADPYCLSYDLNWDINKTDAVAVELLNLGFNDKRRVDAAIAYAVSKLCFDHHGAFVYMNDETVGDMLAIINSVLLYYKGRRFSSMFGIEDTPDNRKRLRDSINTNEKLYLTRNGSDLLIYLRSMYELETETAELTANRLSSKMKRIPVDKLRRAVEDYDIELRARNRKPDGTTWGLDDMQKTAIVDALTEPLSVINGGAGTGKSTIVDGIIYVANHVGMHHPVIMTPTHKAKARMLECLSADSQRILTKGEQLQIYTLALFLSYHALADKPLCSVKDEAVIIDETSMMSLHQAKQLLSAASEAKRLIFIGDYHQLPSIDPGCFFKDLCGLDIVKRTELQTCYRADGAAIVRNAWRINNGEAGLEWVPGEFEFHEFGYDNYAGIIAAEYEALVNAGTSMSDICCLSPAKSSKYPTGVDAINLAVQARLNKLPTVTPKPQVSFGECEFSLEYGHAGYSVVADKDGNGIRIGDRVVVQTNGIPNAKNGDTGVVTAFTYPDDKDAENSISAKVHISLDNGNHIAVKRSDLQYGKISLGYCVTIHKSQGSEYKYVLLSVPNDRRLNVMMQRELIYTAVTRAKHCVKIYGAWFSMYGAITRAPEERTSLLGERILSEMH